MARQVSELSIFVASPDDVIEERERLEEVVRELNVIWSKSKGVRLTLVRWETHSYPGMSSDPQALINEQIGDDYDIFLGLLWKKFGTATPRAGSGTEEEFNRAYNRYRKDSKAVRIMFYFKTGKVNPSEIDIEQLGRVQNFKKTLGPKGTLFWEFETTDEFANFVRLHLSRCVDDWGKTWGTGLSASVEVSEEEPPTPEESDDDGFLDLIEDANLNFEQLNEQSDRISQSTAAFGAKIAERTQELAQANDSGAEMDSKLVKRICNTAAADLESYASALDLEVPLFANTFTHAVASFAKAATLLPDFSADDRETAEEIDEVILAAEKLYDSIEEAAQSMDGFREAIATSPRMTTQYNRAKRHSLTTLERFLAEMRSGNDSLVECRKSLTAMRAELPSTDTEQQPAAI